jgi:hypothetical protein
MEAALAALRAALGARLPLAEARLDPATLALAAELEPSHDASVPHPDGPETEPAKVRG